MAEVAGPSSETITETVQTGTPPPPQQEGRSLTIKLRKRKTEKKVEWSSDTVDNEHMGRRSSKCCCIYEKPRQFGESSSESEGEDEEGCGSAHCILGHGRGQAQRGSDGGGGTSGGSTTPPSSDNQKSKANKSIVHVRTDGRKLHSGAEMTSVFRKTKNGSKDGTFQPEPYEKTL